MLPEKPYKVKCLFCGHPFFLSSDCKSFTCRACYQENHSLIQFRSFALKLNDFFKENAAGNKKAGLNEAEKIIKNPKKKEISSEQRKIIRDNIESQIDSLKGRLGFLEEEFSTWELSEENTKYYNLGSFLKLALNNFAKVSQDLDDFISKFTKNAEFIEQSLKEKHRLRLKNKVKSLEASYLRILEIIPIKVTDLILYFEKTISQLKEAIDTKNPELEISHYEDSDDNAEVYEIYEPYTLNILIKWSQVYQIEEILEKVEKRVYLAAKDSPELSGLKDGLEELKYKAISLELKVDNLREEIEAFEKKLKTSKKISNFKNIIAEIREDLPVSLYFILLFIVLLALYDLFIKDI